jgi:hypothetical protein
MSNQAPEFERSDQDPKSESQGSFRHEASSHDGLVAEEVPSSSKRRLGRQNTRRRRKKRFLQRKYVLTATAALIKEYISPFPGFLDAYWGIHAEKPSYSRAMRASMEAIFPLWKNGSKYYVHHPDNVGLTTAFANGLKGDDLPTVVGLAAEALREKDAQRNLDKIERAFDHCAEIRHVIPYSKAGRWEDASKTRED